MAGLGSILFTDVEQHTIVNKQKAELYMQIYQYAAEDFLTLVDANTYNFNMTHYLTSLELQMERLMTVIASHTHIDSKGGTTSPPLSAPMIRWVQQVKPSIRFTSGAVPNIMNNRVVVGTALDGAPIVGLRRSQPLEILLTVTLPPVMTASLKGLA